MSYSAWELDAVELLGAWRERSTVLRHRDLEFQIFATKLDHPVSSPMSVPLHSTPTAGFPFPCQTFRRLS